jgi:hypothetical protein
MMEEETLRLIIRHLNELKTDINDVKMELKNDIENSISAVKDEGKAAWQERERQTEETLR